MGGRPLPNLGSPLKKGTLAGQRKEEAGTLTFSNNCFTAQQTFEARQATFAKTLDLNAFVSFVQANAEEDDLNVLREGGIEQGNLIFLHFAMKMAENVMTSPAKLIRCIFSILTWHPDGGAPRICYKDAYPEASLGHAGPLAKAQAAVVLHVADKILRCNDVKQQTVALAEVRAAVQRLRGVPAAIKDIDTKSPTASVLLPAGWYPQPLVDLICLSTIGEAMSHAGLGKSPTVEKDSLPPYCRVEIKNLVDGQKQVSARITSYFKKVTGPDQRLRKLWESCVTTAKETTDFDQLVREVDVSEFEKMLAVLDAGLAMAEDEEVYNAVAVMVNDHEAKMKAFGHVYGGAPAPGEADPQRVLAQKISGSLTSAGDLMSGRIEASMILANTMLSEPSRLKNTHCPDTGEEIEPPEIEDLRWQQALLEVLVCYHTAAPAVVHEVLQRTILVLACVDLGKKLLDEKEEKDILPFIEEWATLSSKEQEVTKTKARFASGTDGAALQDFLRLADGIASKLTLNILVHFVSGDSISFTQAALSAIRSLRDVLPKEAENIEKAGQSVLAIEKEATKAKSTTPLQDLGSMLAEYGEGPGHKLYPKVMARATSLAIVRASWRSQVETHFGKINELDSTATDVKEKLRSADVFKSIEDWNFEKCKWLLKPQAEANKMATRKLERMIAMAAGIERTQGLLTKFGPGLGDPAMSEKINTRGVKLESATRNLKEAAILYGCVFVLATLLAGDDDNKTTRVSAAVDYIRENVKVTLQELPVRLRTEVTTATGKSAPAMTEQAEPRMRLGRRGRDGVESAAAPAGEEAPPAKKHFKKLRLRPQGLSFDLISNPSSEAVTAPEAEGAAGDLPREPHA